MNSYSKRVFNSEAERQAALENFDFTVKRKTHLQKFKDVMREDFISLASDPEKSILRICQYLGIKYDVGVSTVRLYCRDLIDEQKNKRYKQ